MAEGLLITFEGIDGVGKTTQVKLLQQQLAARGYDVETYREPGGNEISEKIRALLLDVQNRGMKPMTEALLYAAARAQLVQDVLIPRLKQGTVILADRFTDSTIAYQGYGRGLDIDTLHLLNRIAAGDVQPDLTILLDMKAEDAWRRRRNDIEDRLELEGIEFQERVRQGYLQVAEKSHRFMIVDAAQDSEDIAREILTRVLSLIGARKNG